MRPTSFTTPRRACCRQATVSRTRAGILVSFRGRLTGAGSQHAQAPVVRPRVQIKPALVDAVDPHAPYDGRPARSRFTQVAKRLSFAEGVTRNRLEITVLHQFIERRRKCSVLTVVQLQGESQEQRR